MSEAPLPTQSVESPFDAGYRKAAAEYPVEDEDAASFYYTEGYFKGAGVRQAQVDDLTQQLNAANDEIDGKVSALLRARLEMADKSLGQRRIGEARIVIRQILDEVPDA